MNGGDRLNFFGQYIEGDNLMLPVYVYQRERQAMCTDEKELEVGSLPSRSTTRYTPSTSKKKY